MDPNLKIVVILTIGFGFASFFAYLAQLVRLPSILGYLLAGFLIGPYSPGFVADVAISEQLAEVGVIMMLFGVGLHFKLQDLINVKNVAIVGATGQTLAAAALTTALMHFAGWSVASGLIMGLSIGVASTVVLVRVLSDNRLLNTQEGHIAVGWLVVEDIFTVIVLILLPTLGAYYTGESVSFATFFGSMFVALVKFAVLVIFMFTLGHRIVSYLLMPIARLRSHELFTITVLALVFIIAAGSSILFGTSIALGSFIAGMVVGKTSVKHQAAANALPLKDIFAIIFFLSVGMLFNPQAISSHLSVFAGIISVILIAKPLVAYLITTTMGYPLKVALTLAISLAQIGEFSFILAEESLKWGLFPEDGYDILVACALVSISINPLLFQLLRYFEPSLQKFTSPKIKANNIPSKAVVIGLGTIGRDVSAILKKAGIMPTIIEHNIDTVTLEGDHDVIFGDATQEDILKQAFIEEAQILLITIPDTAKTLEIIREARLLNPAIEIVARVRFIAEKSLINSLMVNYICTEGEVLRSFSHQVRQMLNNIKKTGKTD